MVVEEGKGEKVTEEWGGVCVRGKFECNQLNNVDHPTKRNSRRMSYRDPVFAPRQKRRRNVDRSHNYRKSRRPIIPHGVCVYTPVSIILLVFIFEIIKIASLKTDHSD